jgi:Na+-transporting methylmalonyl-CoA/oxaloacetate decarboxylase beta subunit
MRNRKSTIHIGIGILISAILASKHIIRASLLIAPVLNIFDHEVASIGLIGGADGPVSVFVSSPLGAFLIMPFIEFIGMIYILVLLIQYYRKSRKENIEQTATVP